MNNEPCVRFGIRISPKISEKPAESRKSRPPSVTLLTASTNQIIAPATRSALQRRIVPRVHGLRQEPLLVVRPELADLGIGLDGRVDELAALHLHAADVEAPDDVAQVIEAERSPRSVGERHGAQRLHEAVAVLGLAA